MKAWITRKWTVLGILALFWLAFTTGYAMVVIENSPTTSRGYEIVKFVFLSTSAFGVLFSTLLASFNSLEASLNVEARTHFDRVENSFAYMHRWDTDLLTQARDFTRTIRDRRDDFSPNELRQAIATDKNLERSVIMMFNFFEELELSIRAKRVDEQLLLKAFRHVFCDIHDRFRPWLETQDHPEVREHLQGLRNRFS